MKLHDWLAEKTQSRAEVLYLVSIAAIASFVLGLSLR